MALVEDLEQDDFLKKYIHSDLSVNDHVAELLKSTDLSGQITQIGTQIGKLDQQIHLQVTKHHGDLLAQTENVEMMEQVVKRCHARSKTCQTDKLLSQVHRLHTELNTEVTRVDNLYKTKQALRRIEEVLAVFERIDKQKNLAQVATNISQIEHICGLEPPLSFLKSYLEKATSLRQNIEKQTENMFNQGLNANSAAQVTSSLQIFLNLNVLESKIDKVFTETEKAIERDVKNALQVKLQTPLDKGKGPGRVISPHQGGINTQIRGQIWTNLEGLSTKLVSSASKLKLLWYNLTTERDSVTNYNFSEFIEKDMWTKFWNNFLDILLKHFSSTQVEFIKLTLEGKEFPKLLLWINGLGVKLEEVKDTPGITLNVQSGLRGVVSNYEKAFLSKSLAKLFDSVNTVFAKGGVPSRREIDSLLKLISSEMGSIEDPMLKKLIQRNISKTISLVCVRCENLIFNDGNATQVIGQATEAQQSNAAVLNLLEYIKSQQQPADVEGIDNLMRNSIMPLMDAISDAIQAIIMTIHNENFKRKTRGADYSLYMGELQSFIARAAKDYLSLFQCSDLVQKCGRNLSARTVEFFLRNISILSSIADESTLSQIIIDLNQLEITLTPFTPALSEIGRQYRIFRGFKTLLGLQLEEIKSSNLIGNVIPYSLAIHLLISLSGGEILHPHTANGWSISRYSKWLDEHHGEEERLYLLRNPIIQYHKSVTDSGQTSYSKYFPIIHELLEKGLKIS